jgi:GT2 family glycosyltransferase
MDARADGTALEAGQAGMVTLFAGLQPPRVAVVVGCHEQAAYVEAAIRSVAAQSYENFECVVLDDCSADGSADRIGEVLESLGDPRFRAILRRENGGQMVTMLEGLDATSSPFVAFLDADDLWHPAFLKRHVLAHMSSRGIAAVSCSNLAVVDADGTQLSGGKPNVFSTDLRRPHLQHLVVEEVLDAETRLFIAPGIMAEWIWCATSAMIFRRTVLETLRPARPEQLRICADLYLARGAHMLGGTVRIERSLGCYRLHGKNGFARNSLLGARTALGKPPKDIAVAARNELVQCLCDKAEQLCKTLSRSYVANLLLELVGSEGAFALAASNAGARLLLESMPQPRPERTHLQKIKRRLKRWLRLKAKTKKGSRSPST